MSSPVPDSDPDYYDVVFLHPDLGIGGAERAIVDAAVALQRAPPPLPTGDDESSDFESQEGVRRRTGRGVNAADTGSSREPAINGTGGSSSSGGYRVLLITAHHDPTRCFDETRDGTLRVIVAGSRIPRSIFGRLQALCAYTRMAWAAAWLVLGSGLRFSVAYVDQVPVGVPLVRLLSMLGRFVRRRSGPRTVFYVHYPDQLLTDRTSSLKRLYRAPIDALERTCIANADCLLANSRFTEGVLRRTFGWQDRSRYPVQIVYPVPDTAALEALSTGHSGAGELQARAELLKRHGLPTAHRAPFFLSINRFERKKNLRLALDALVELHRLLEEDAAASPGSRLAARASELRPRLVFCGGYDERVVDCVSTARQLDELSRRAFPNSDSSTELTSPNADAEGRTLTETTDDRYVYLVRNVSSLEKAYLLRNALALIYTPVEEHFGIVPVEAMRLGCPVIACDSGGPLETVVDGETGYLCPPDAKEFAQRMRMLFKSWLLRNESRSAARCISTSELDAHSATGAAERSGAEEAEGGTSELAGLRERLSAQAVRHSNERLGFPEFERTLHEVVGREVARVRGSRGTSWITRYEFAAEIMTLAVLSLLLAFICYLFLPAAMFAA